uniref:Ig-like domain-containing protein n=1 Tax=Leptobrachium leishanense TaxID=445787 RepID=A0A8C5M486_9ANUR
MEVKHLLIIAFVIHCNCKDSIMEPVLEIRGPVMDGETVDIVCSWNYKSEGKVNLYIKLGEETLTSCTQENTPYPKVTCEPEVDKNFHGKVVTCEVQLVIRSKSETIFVNSDPFFTDCPKNITWVEGEKKAFECKAGGYPPPNVTCSMGSISYKEGETFTVSKSMAGKYICKAHSIDTVSIEIYVHVESKPSILHIDGPPESQVTAGKNVTLTCEAYGDPAPAYSWETPKSDVEISSDGRTVSIWDMKPAYKGTYTCKAQNKHGNDTKSLTLTMPAFGSQAALHPKSDTGLEASNWRILGSRGTRACKKRRSCIISVTLNQWFPTVVLKYP